MYSTTVKVHEHPLKSRRCQHFRSRAREIRGPRFILCEIPRFILFEKSSVHVKPCSESPRSIHDGGERVWQGPPLRSRSRALHGACGMPLTPMPSPAYLAYPGTPVASFPAGVPQRVGHRRRRSSVGGGDHQGVPAEARRIHPDRVLPSRISRRAPGKPRPFLP